MTQTKKSTPRSTALAAMIVTGAFAAMLAVPSTASAQLVVTPNQAEDVRGALVTQSPNLAITDQDVRALDIVQTGTDLDTPIETYDEDSPGFDLVTQDATELRLGVLRQASPTAANRPYRDPYTVDSVTTDPLYPEGIYVDDLETNAGLGLSAKF